LHLSVVMNQVQTEQRKPPIHHPPDAAAQQLRWYQRWVIAVCGFGMRWWTRSVRLRFGADVKAFLDQPTEPAVFILWHNRLLMAPELYRRYLPDRKVAGLISASQDGAWLASFFKQLKIRPIRGSRHGRAVPAFRELLKVLADGYNVGITPDGSRGPIYDMKAGAVTLAIRSGVPIVLLSYNYTRAWRLRTWDRFYLPLPFSRVHVKLDIVGDGRQLANGDFRQAATILRARMLEITDDDEYFSA